MVISKLLFPVSKTLALSMLRHFSYIGFNLTLKQNEQLLCHLLTRLNQVDIKLCSRTRYTREPLKGNLAVYDLFFFSSTESFKWQYYKTFPCLHPDGEESCSSLSTKYAIDYWTDGMEDSWFKQNMDEVQLTKKKLFWVDTASSLKVWNC